MNCPHKSIVLIGMMGAGKSAVGRCLQQRTGFPRFDIDEMVSSKFGIPISQIFSTCGEDKFREAETEVLGRISPHQRSIIVTGGGIILREINVGLLKRLGAVVWLAGQKGTLFNRASRTDNRPLLQGKNPRKAFAESLQVRLPLYAKIADIRVDTSALTAEEVAIAILTKLKGDWRKSTST
ncbi:MAG: shikimate kinase [Candidatus Udaeobacter sp.]